MESAYRWFRRKRIADGVHHHVCVCVQASVCVAAYADRRAWDEYIGSARYISDPAKVCLVIS